MRLGLILGSGLGHIVGAVTGVQIPYADLPGFPGGGVSGHTPMLGIGDPGRIGQSSRGGGRDSGARRLCLVFWSVV